MSSVRVRVVASGLVLALAVAGGAVALRAQQAPEPKAVPAHPAQAAPAGHPSAAGPEASLLDVMDEMKARLKSLSASCTVKAQEPALAAVMEMQRLILVAKAFEPNTMADKPEAERPAHLTAYRKELLRTLKELADLEADLLDGNFDAATKRVETSLPDLRDEAHEQFKKQRRR